MRAWVAASEISIMESECFRQVLAVAVAASVVDQRKDRQASSVAGTTRLLCTYRRPGEDRRLRAGDGRGW